jgi:hypothetical protein
MDEELPSRGEFYSDRFLWLREKGALDRERAGEAEGEGLDRLWIVQGKLYDLASYLDKHPGGREFLELTQGMDVTALVERCVERRARPESDRSYLCRSIH